MSSSNVTNRRNLVLSQLQYSEEAALEVAVREHLEKYATESRAAWADEISGAPNSD
jgi:hypothetical protein